LQIPTIIIYDKGLSTKWCYFIGCFKRGNTLWTNVTRNPIAPVPKGVSLVAQHGDQGHHQKAKGTEGVDHGTSTAVVGQIAAEDSQLGSGPV